MTLSHTRGAQQRLGACAAIGLIAIATATASAQISYVSQTRSVSSSRTGFPPQFFSASNFLPFNATANSGGATAIQNSTLNPGTIIWSGSGQPAAGSPPGSASSEFDVVFDLPVRSLFTWNTGSGGAPPIRNLTGPNTSIVANWNGTIQSGILEPGRYRLRIIACCFTGGTSTFTIDPRPFTIDWFTIDGGGAMNLTGGALSLSGTIGQHDAAPFRSGGLFELGSGFWSGFEIFCPADFNRDGNVDFFDYLDFVSAFDAEAPSADFNGDNTVDFFDYLDFVAAFDSNC